MRTAGNHQHWKGVLDTLLSIPSCNDPKTQKGQGGYCNPLPPEELRVKRMMQHAGGEAFLRPYNYPAVFQCIFKTIIVVTVLWHLKHWTVSGFLEYLPQSSSSAGFQKKSWLWRAKDNVRLQFLCHYSPACLRTNQTALSPCCKHDLWETSKPNPHRSITKITSLPS